jgi:hypothetical protein
MQQLVSKMQVFLGFKKNLPKDDESESQETALETEKIGFLNDICFENKILNKCGLGVSEEEAFLVYTSVKGFNKKYASTKTRFWGKIFGLEHDYYILESETEEKEGEDDVNLEVRRNFIEYLIYISASL